MRTHKEITILAVVEKASDVAKCVATPDDNVFPTGEMMRSVKIRGYNSGTYLVIKVRCSEKYRFILDVKATTPELLKPFAVNPDVKWIAEHRIAITALHGELGAELAKVQASLASAVASIAETKPAVDTAPQAYYHITREHKMTAELAIKMLKRVNNRPVKILAHGESGYGKTTLAQYIAQKEGMTCFRMNCATVRDPEEWFGQRSAKDGTTMFERSTFINTMETGNCVIILDEYNRMEPWIANSLFPLLDDDAATTVMNETFRVGPNVIFFATINLGFEYTGTFTVDAAMSNRFNFFVEVGELDATTEVKIVTNRFPSLAGRAPEVSKIVETSRAIRRLKMIGCTLRTIIQVAEAVDAGASVREAWQLVFVYRCPQDGTSNVRKEVIDVINAKCGPM